MNGKLILALALSSCLLCVAANAGDLYVSQNDPAADNKNPGTEAKPFKTIQPAVDAAKPGDTVYVKAGVYGDVVKLRTFGSPYHPNTLTAWKDDRVVIGSELRDLPPAEQWKPIAGHKSFQVQIPEGTPEDLMVLIDGKPMVTQYKDTVPADDVYNWAHYRKSDRMLMLNTGDGNPAAVHKLQFARDICPFMVTEMSGFWRIRKLEFAYVRQGIGMDGTGILLEDCYFHNTYRPAVFCTGRASTIRRCNFYRCGYAMAGGHGVGSIIEDCLIVQCGQEPPDDVDCRVSNDFTPVGGPICFKGGPAVGGTVRYNIIADSPDGLWYDGPGTSLKIIGNAFWSNKYGHGIYNEFGVMDTLITGNYFYRTGVRSSWSTRMTTIDNFFFGGSKDSDQGCGIGWLNRDVWPLRNTFMTARNNAITASHMGYLAGDDRGTEGLYPEGFARAFVDYNRVRTLPGDTVLYRSPTTICKTLQEIQQKYGWDLHGEVKWCKPSENDLTPESMGGTMVTFRVPWGPRNHLARPMLADTTIEGKWPAAVEYGGPRFPSFFWRFADGNCDENTLKYEFTDMTSDRLWQPNCNAGYDVGSNRGAAWYIEGEDKYPDPKMHVEKPYNRAEMTTGNRWLVVQGQKPQDMPPSGVGWWTSWLAAAPGAKITVSFRMLGKKIESSDKAMPVVYMQFISATGQQVKRAYLVGRGEAQLDDVKMLHRRELTTGSFNWTEVKETITAPDTAVRMALFLGMLPCKGEVGFDDINIRTADGEPPPGEVEIVEALPAQIAKERMREIICLDLSKAANRSLTSPAAGDGKGWTDQGPDLDMRKLPTGSQSYGGVPFQLLTGDKAVIVLKGSGKAGKDLPQEVTIPVGGRKIEALYILHANAMMDPKLQWVLTVAVKYKDGSKADFGFDSGMLADWLAPPVREFWGNRPTTAALTVPVGKDKKGTIYRTEWILDRVKHGVPVESVILRGTGDGVPIILGLTGVTQW